MEAHVASVVVVKPTVQKLKVTGLKKHIACICLHPTNKRKKVNDPIIKCTHMGQKLTYMVHKDKIWTSRGKIIKVKQFLELHP